MEDSTRTCHEEDCMAYCRFRGAFTLEERELVEQAVAAVEEADGSGLSPVPGWLVVRATPAANAVYLGVRFRDNRVVHASALDALIDGIEALRHSG